MTSSAERQLLLPTHHDLDVDPTRLAAAAYLARFSGLPGRFKDASRVHTECDLRAYLTWRAQHELAPLAAVRDQVELYVRWMQEIHRLKPSTVSRQVSVVAGFSRTCVIDSVIPPSPAEHVRRPHVSSDSPTLGLTHLQLEALLVAARTSPNPADFALVAMLDLLGLRIFEACRADITDVGEEHGHRVLQVHGKGDKTVLVPLPPAVGRAIDTAIGERMVGPILLNSRSVRMDRHVATRRLHHLAGATGMRMPNLHPHLLRHTFVTTLLDAGVSLRDVQIAARHADPRTTMRYDRARNNLDRHPNYILAAYMASGTRPRLTTLPMSVHAILALDRPGPSSGAGAGAVWRQATTMTVLPRSLPLLASWWTAGSSSSGRRSAICSLSRPLSTRETRSARREASGPTHTPAVRTERVSSAGTGPA